LVVRRIVTGHDTQGKAVVASDEGQVAHLKPGDVVIQRVTVHIWANRGSIPAVTAYILIDARPAEVNGELPRTIFPAPR